MNTIDFSQQSEDYQRIEGSIRFIENNFDHNLLYHICCGELFV